MTGTVESLWRYPVKSMRGEELDAVAVHTGGVAGDRVFAFRSAAARAEFPYFTAREQPEMLRYQPRFRRATDVQTPAGDVLAIDDPGLMERLLVGIDPKHRLTLLRSDRALADAYPVSLISVQTAAKLGAESGTPADKHRFRANIILDLPETDGFAENEFVGHKLRLGPHLVVSILKRDTRCAMITLDPFTGAKTPSLLQAVAQNHGGTAGVYGLAVAAGTVRKGDRLALVE